VGAPFQPDDHPVEQLPSVPERVAATAWLWLRRAACFAVAGIFIFADVRTVYPSFLDQLFSPPAGNYTAAENLGFIAGSVVAISLLVFTGIFGAIRKGITVRGLIEEHRERMRRYGWSW
jgi:hypothetical protein